MHACMLAHEEYEHVGDYGYTLSTSMALPFELEITPDKNYYMLQWYDERGKLQTLHCIQ